ncbi:MAG: hypothetical protein JWM89_3895 [Acidimicrobiales bacterium]|nr:hypothetical protein [Acidimicrobiales bacterium]
MLQVVLIVAIGGAAVGVAQVLRRRGSDAPEQGASWTVPAQLDRTDFAGSEVPWLVAVFSSSTCLACGDTWEKAKHLDSAEVVVQELDAVEDKAVHQRYGIDAVPLVLVADAEGVVRRSFVGPPTATDLWAALAELREPGTVPPGCTEP